MSLRVFLAAVVSATSLGRVPLSYIVVVAVVVATPKVSESGHITWYDSDFFCKSFPKSNVLETPSPALASCLLGQAARFVSPSSTQFCIASGPFTQ
jgi:hypothetical protein